MEEDGSHSKDKEICSLFVGMSNDNISTIDIYLWYFFSNSWIMVFYIHHLLLEYHSNFIGMQKFQRKIDIL